MFKFLFSYFLGEGEREFIPLPDKIIVNGNNALNLLKEEGYPLERIAVGGAWRYTYLFENIKQRRSSKNSDMVGLLVLLPVSKHISEFVIDAIVQYYSKIAK